MLDGRLGRQPSVGIQDQEGLHQRYGVVAAVPQHLVQRMAAVAVDLLAQQGGPEAGSDRLDVPLGHIRQGQHDFLYLQMVITPKSTLLICAHWVPVNFSGPITPSEINMGVISLPVIAFP